MIETGTLALLPASLTSPQQGPATGLVESPGTVTSTHCLSGEQVIVLKYIAMIKKQNKIKHKVCLCLRGSESLSLSEYLVWLECFPTLFVLLELFYHANSTPSLVRTFVLLNS